MLLIYNETMAGYYADRLAAVRLQRVYEIATPPVQRYLAAEQAHVLDRLDSGAAVLELGCGYGRVLQPLAEKAGLAVGIDTSLSSLLLAERLLPSQTNCRLVQMDAAALGFPDRLFDLVVCIQNGISAFHVDQRHLLTEALRVTRSGGIAFFSSYSTAFWPERLRWFELQAEAGLVGEIDYQKTRNGVIVCRDGFTATTVDETQFRELSAGLNASITIREVASSSLFCELRRL